MNKANYKDTQITSTKVGLVLFLSLLEYVLVCWGILRNNELEEF